jgi:hypothetical protein
VSSSLAKNFAIAFYRYRMWLDEQEVPLVERNVLLRDTNHFLAYMTFSDTDYRPVFQRQALLQKARRAYRRFLRESMNMDSDGADSMLESVRHFLDFNAMSVAASSKPAAAGKKFVARVKSTPTQKQVQKQGAQKASAR